MNDIHRTDVFVRHTPEAVACACIFLAARRLGIPLPRHPPWWEMFNVDDESVHEIALCLQTLYARAKPNINDVETRLADVRKRQAEEREANAAAAAAIVTSAMGKKSKTFDSENSAACAEQELNGVKSKSPISMSSEKTQLEECAASVTIKSSIEGSNDIASKETKDPEIPRYFVVSN